MSFSTNPYSGYHTANSKEFIGLNKAALINLKPDKQFKLLPSNADAFAAEFEALSKKFSYNGVLKRVSTTWTVNSDDGTITFSNFRDILESWNQITLNIVLKNANQNWGDKSWTDIIPCYIVDLSNTRGKIDAELRITLNATGTNMFMLRWRLQVMTNDTLALLTHKVQKATKIYQPMYEWHHKESGDTAQDGLTLVTIVLQKMHPNVQINISNKIGRIKQLKLSQYNSNVTV